MPRNTGRRVKDNRTRMAKNTGHGSRHAAQIERSGQPIERDWKNDIQPYYAAIEDWGYPVEPKKNWWQRFWAKW